MSVPRLDATATWSVQEDFREGLLLTGPAARWAYQSAGPHVADDGRVSTGPDGLHVAASGVHPATGQPQFVRSVAPADRDQGGLPGTLDHVKWLVQASHVASSGHRGLDVPDGHRLTVSMTASARTSGTDAHPFGAHVQDPHTDLRLAAAAVTCYDPETSLVFSFFLTDRQLYAFYERLPFARTASRPYASFSYAVPVAAREPADWHDLAVTYDRVTGGVSWLVDGSEVLGTDRPGDHLPDRRHLVLDHGGVPETVRPQQINYGIGLFTLLDAVHPVTGGPGLVRLNTADGFYVDPVRGTGHAPPFVDEQSRDGSRLFGQGAELRVRRVVVQGGPAAGSRPLRP
ncbi:MAG TPA: DUF6081 family protein [Kineosporiaceae bacterium]